MAYQTKVMEIPPSFYIGDQIKGKSKTIRDIQRLTGAEIIIPIQECEWKPEPETLEIRGSPNAVKFAEEFVLAFFKHQDPSMGSNGLHNSFLSEIVSNLPTDSILREKIVTFSPRFLAKKMPQNKLTTPQFFSDVYY